MSDEFADNSHEELVSIVSALRAELAETKRELTTAYAVLDKERLEEIDRIFALTRERDEALAALAQARAERDAAVAAWKFAKPKIMRVWSEIEMWKDDAIDLFDAMDAMDRALCPEREKSAPEEPKVTERERSAWDEPGLDRVRETAKRVAAAVKNMSRAKDGEG